MNDDIFKNKSTCNCTLKLINTETHFTAEMQTLNDITGLVACRDH